MSTTTALEYEVLEKIGHGSFGIIRKVKRKSDSLILCRKEINYGKMSQKEREQLHAEFQCLSSLRHPNIVAYYHREHLKAQQELHLYMEYCGSGDLGRVIKDLRGKGQRATESFVWHTFSQLVSALYRCHYGVDPPEIGTDYIGLIEGAQNRKAPQGSVVIMHRDLKPENVFLGKDNSVKLGDFGLSKMIKSHDFASTYVGTPYYMSPEICAAERYTLKSDIWSLGCIIYELCAREPPFNAKTHYQLVQKIKSGKYTPLPDCYSGELAATIHECLRINPDERPSTFNLLQLPIMRLMRKEKEVSDMNSLLKEKEAALNAREAKLAAELETLEKSKDYARHEIDASLRREWEVKAQLEITKHVNMEVENLHRQFELEVRARVEAELKQRPVPHTVELATRTRTSSSSDVKSSNGPEPRSSLTPPADPDAPPSTAAAAAADAGDMFSADAPEALARRGTPKMRRVHTMFAGNVATPGDVEMSEPSPVAISSLALSPRRNPGSKAPAATTGNIFRAAADSWTVPRDCHTPESDDDEDLVPSPTRNIRSNKNPFMARNRPALSGSSSKPTTTAAVTSAAGPTSKPLPHLPGGESPKTSTQSLDAHHHRATSPARRLSKIPSAANLVHRHTEPASTTLFGLARKTSSKKDEAVAGGGLISKIATKSNNNLRGRTLVELQQARAGGRPLSAVQAAPGIENLSPKRNKEARAAAFGGGRRASDLTPAVWDPELDEMPSPFLSRTKPRLRV